MRQIWDFWIGEPTCTETDLKKSHICPIWGQSDPIWMPNLTSLFLALKVPTPRLMYSPPRDFTQNNTAYARDGWVSRIDIKREQFWTLKDISASKMKWHEMQYHLQTSKICPIFCPCEPLWAEPVILDSVQAWLTFNYEVSLTSQDWKLASFLWPSV